MKRTILALLILLAPLTVQADEPWISIGTTPGTELVLTDLLPVGQYELAVRAYSPGGPSDYSDTSQPVAIVPAAVKDASINALTSRGWAVFRFGDTLRATWTGSTYPVDGTPVPADSYEVYKRTISRLGTCSKPGAVQVVP